MIATVATVGTQPTYQQMQTMTNTKEQVTGSSFEMLYQSALNLLQETNQYTHEAEEAQMAYALGLNDNIHDLMIAQNKANISLQYTVAVRDGVVDAYREIMQMQF